MQTIITHPAQEAHPDLDAAAGKRADRLAKATTDQMQATLAYLSMIDSEAFEIAFSAVPHAPDDSEDEEPIPLCATCGAPVGIFPEVFLNWRHFRGAASASGIHETYDPGHASEAAWYLPDEAAEELRVTGARVRGPSLSRGVAAAGGDLGLQDGRCRLVEVRGTGRSGADALRFPCRR